MSSKVLAFPIIILVVSLSTIGFVSAQTNETSQGTTCTQDDIQNAKQGLASIKEKITQLRTEYYNDWQTAHNSGQYNGTWDSYAKEKLWSTQDAAQIKLDYMKFSSILKSCGVMQSPPSPNMMRPSYLPNTMQQLPYNSTCTRDDISHAKQELGTTEKQYGDMKAKVYQDFQQAKTSGEYNGTWQDYAHDKFANATGMSHLGATHNKFTNFLKRCYGQVIPQSIPQNSGDTLQNVPGELTQNPSDTTQNIPSESTQNTSMNPMDALTVSAGQGIPTWVKGVAGWWSEGKISDGDFVSAIKFLIHQGIIKV